MQHSPWQMRPLRTLGWNGGLWLLFPWLTRGKSLLSFPEKAMGIDLAFLVPAWPLCHQSVGLIARAIEQDGIPTVSMSSAYDLTAVVKPPRICFTCYPLGHTIGKPYDRENQMAIIRSALDNAREITEPCTIVELPFVWDDPLWLAKA